MARRKRETMSEGKKNIIGMLLWKPSIVLLKNGRTIIQTQ